VNTRNVQNSYNQRVMRTAIKWV